MMLCHRVSGCVLLVTRLLSLVLLRSDKATSDLCLTKPFDAQVIIDSGSSIKYRVQERIIS